MSGHLEVSGNSCSILEEADETTSGLQDGWLIATFDNLGQKKIPQ
jgi:hypothetical protein